MTNIDEKEIEVELGDQKETPQNVDAVKNKVLDREKTINQLLEGLTPEQKQLEINAWIEKYGLSEKQFKGAVNNIQAQINAEPTGNLEPSTIFAGLGILPIEQIVKVVDKSYPFADLFPIITAKNGKKLVFYSDFNEADDLAGYIVPDDYVAKLYQPDEGIQTYEEWGTNINIHKGLLMPSIALNDFTSKTSIFMALFDNYAFQVAHPIAKVLYKIRLGLIQNPFNYSTPTDWNTLPIDKSFENTNAYQLLTDLKTYFKSLATVSRTNTPDRYKITGFSKHIENSVSPDNCVLIVPNEFTAYIDTQMRSGAFNQEYLNLIPEFVSVDYNKTFVEYSAATNVKSDLTDFVAFLVPRGSANILQHFKGTRAAPLLTLHSVIHTYHRIGRSIDKTKPVYNISIKLTKPAAKAKKAA